MFWKGIVIVTSSAKGGVISHGRVGFLTCYKRKVQVLGRLLENSLFQRIKHNFVIQICQNFIALDGI